MVQAFLGFPAFKEKFSRISSPSTLACNQGEDGSDEAFYKVETLFKILLKTHTVEIEETQTSRDQSRRNQDQTLGTASEEKAAHVYRHRTWYSQDEWHCSCWNSETKRQKERQSLR